MDHPVYHRILVNTMRNRYSFRFRVLRFSEFRLLEASLRASISKWTSKGKNKYYVDVRGYWLFDITVLKGATKKKILKSLIIYSFFF